MHGWLARRWSRQPRRHLSASSHTISLSTCAMTLALLISTALLAVRSVSVCALARSARRASATARCGSSSSVRYRATNSGNRSGACPYWGAADSDFPLGHIQLLGKSDRDILRTGAPWFAPGPALDYLAKHAIDFWLTTEDLPDPHNRVTVDRRGAIHLAKASRDTEPHRRLLAKLKDLLGPMGCHQTSIPRWSVLSKQNPLAGIAHNCGTVRFGTDPKRSALDVNCKAHDPDNLYVVDTSFFPSSGAVNPALTAMANALRVGDHLIERLGAA
jgi:choline dehydrogenase-like flavoprotein